MNINTDHFNIQYPFQVYVHIQIAANCAYLEIKMSGVSTGADTSAIGKYISRIAINKQVLGFTKQCLLVLCFIPSSYKYFLSFKDKFSYLLILIVITYV